MPDVGDLWLKVLQHNHDHPVAGHFSQNRTIDLIRCSYVWPELQNSVKSYIKSCTTCMHSKPQRHRPYGLLKQLPIPEQPLNSISMDFIEKLPSSSGFDTILVIVDSPNNLFSFLRSILSKLSYSPSCSYSMSSPSTEFCHMLPPTEARSLFHPFSGLSVRLWT